MNFTGLIVMCWYILSIQGELPSAQKESPLSTELSETQIEVPLQPISDQPQQVEDPLVQMKHLKSVLNEDQRQEIQSTLESQQQAQQQDQHKDLSQQQTQQNDIFQQQNHQKDLSQHQTQKDDILKQQNQQNDILQQQNHQKDLSQQQTQQLNQPFQHDQQFNQPFQQSTQAPQNQINQPYQNNFLANPFSFISQNLFGNLGYNDNFGPQYQSPTPVTGTHSETLFHLNKNPALQGRPVAGFNPPAPGSHQEVAVAHRNWFEAQMKNMQNKVQSWFKP